MIAALGSGLAVLALAIAQANDAANDADAGRSLPLTAAESSRFTRTSTSTEVAQLVDACVVASPKILRLSLATSAQGRDVPLVVVADPPAKSIAEARAGGKLSVLIVANIHGGEVEGKEAAQILLRELALGRHAELLDSLVIACVPNYNPDGNDALDRKNRPDQNGPIEGVGQRANGQGLDLNRDFVKCDAPETRSLLAAVQTLDPALVIDLHATDGSFHGYDLTYAGAMHPASDPGLLLFTRETLLPTLRADMKARGFATFDYGDFADLEKPEKGWFTFEHLPRYGTNYFGLENRLTLLSEAYSHEPFERRIAATGAFVLAALQFAAARADELARLRLSANRGSVALADRGAALPTRAVMKRTRERDVVLVGAVTREKDPVTGLERLLDAGEARPVTMPVHVTFEGQDEKPVPVAWAIEAPTPQVAALLDLHGIACVTLQSPRRARVQRFEVTKRDESKRPFQGRRLVTMAGEERPPMSELLPAGTLVVSAAQPSARLAFTLLEATGDDGFSTWGLLGTSNDGKGRAIFAAARVLEWNE